ncbi:MAG: hypothetical protein ACLFVP_03000 [Candidatus Bathyarchaeia archaeon]
MAIVKLEKLDLPMEEESIIKRALERSLDEITPKIMAENLTYNGLEDLVEEFGLQEFQCSLRALSKKGFLEEREYDRAIFCPNCDSLHVHSKFACPKCDSVNVARKELIEHMHCGYIGNKDSFRSGERLICPNCSTDLGSFDGEPEDSGKRSYTVIGSSFICEKCGHNFDKPKVIHKCTSCGTRFNHKRAIYRKLYAYRLTDKSKSTSSRPETLKLIREMENILREEGFEVESPGEVRGQSNVAQEFNILAQRGEETLAIDISDGEQRDLISLLGKKIDVEADMAALIDLSGKMNRSELAENQKIALLSAKDKNLKAKLAEYIQERTESSIGLF